MQRLGAVRMMDGLGRIVLPAEVRTALNWNTESPLDIYYDTDTGEVHLKAHQEFCAHCGSTENLIKFKNQHICAKCKKEIAKL